jgi:mycofactocin system glycosyltransferase
MTTSLAGRRFVADSSVEVHDRGRVLLGGSPLRVVRLTAPGAEVARTVLDGEPVPAGKGASKLVRRLLDGGLVHPVPDAAGHSTHDVTAVVPVRGELPSELLDGIGPVAAVVVVDDASPVPVTAPERTADGTPVRVVRRSTRGGPGGARDTGLDEVTTPLVAFVDADCLPVPGWLDRLLPHLDDPEVAVVAPRIVQAEPDGIAGPLARYERVRSALDMGTEPARVRARSRVSYVPSAALLARVDDLRAVGGFDDALLVGEDVDLVWRLDEEGRTVRYEPGATVAHRHRTALRPWARRRFDYGTSAGPLAVRHPGALVPVEASPLSLAGWCAAALGRPFTGLGFAGATFAMLLRSFDGIDGAAGLAAQVAGRGNLAVGRMLANALVRPWWPVTLLVALVVPSRRLRRALLVGVLVPPLLEWVREHPNHGPVSYVGLRLADDIAYSAGVWVGAIRARTAEPLLPDLTSWPDPGRYSTWRTAKAAARAASA